MPAMLRSVVETFTRSWRFERSLRIGSRRIPIIVSPSSGLRFLFKPLCRADPQLVRLAEQYVKAGDVVWDVGANLGLFSFPAASMAGRDGAVYCFEPDAWLVQLLRRSARRQPVESAPVQVIPAAAGGETAIRSFSIARRSRAANFLDEYRDQVNPQITGGAIETHPVIVVSLDWAARHLRPPSVLKIDVEGAEREVLAGADALLRSARPVVLCEVFPSSTRDVTNILRGHGYRLLDGDTGGEVPEAQWSTVAIPS